METLIAAIIADDRQRVAQILKSQPGLVKSVFDQQRLCRTSIQHWIYAGDSALHVAAAGYRVEILGMLLDAGADPNHAKSRRAGTALHYASDGNPDGPCFNAVRQVETIRRLLRAGAEINKPDKNGATPLHRAVRTRCADAVDCLLKSGADPLLQNRPGSTAFHLALQNTGRGGSGLPNAKAAQRRIVTLFLATGISTMIQDGKGTTIHDLLGNFQRRDRQPPC